MCLDLDQKRSCCLSGVSASADRTEPGVHLSSTSKPQELLVPHCVVIIAGCTHKGPHSRDTHLGRCRGVVGAGR